jgi:hypothetical protein
MIIEDFKNKLGIALGTSFIAFGTSFFLLLNGVLDV